MSTSSIGPMGCCHFSSNELSTGKKWPKRFHLCRWQPVHKSLETINLGITPGTRETHPLRNPALPHKQTPWCFSHGDSWASWAHLDFWLSTTLPPFIWRAGQDNTKQVLMIGAVAVEVVLMIVATSISSSSSSRKQKQKQKQSQIMSDLSTATLSHGKSPTSTLSSAAP